MIRNRKLRKLAKRMDKEGVQVDDLNVSPAVRDAILRRYKSGFRLKKVGNKLQTAAGATGVVAAGISPLGLPVALGASVPMLVGAAGLSTAGTITDHIGNRRIRNINRYGIYKHLKENARR